MKNLGLILLVLVAALGAWRASVAVPTSYSIKRAAKLKASAEDSWKALSTLDQQEWRSDLRGVEEQPKLRGHSVWKETLTEGLVITLETVESLDGRRLVRCVANQGGPIGGCWTLEVVPRDENSAVQITETIDVHSAWFRLTHSKDSRQEALDRMLTDLAHHFGDDAPRLGKDFPEVSREPEPEKPPEPPPEEPQEGGGL